MYCQQVALFRIFDENRTAEGVRLLEGRSWQMLLPAVRQGITLSIRSHGVPGLRNDGVSAADCKLGLERPEGVVEGLGFESVYRHWLLSSNRHVPSGPVFFHIRIPIFRTRCRRSHPGNGRPRFERERCRPERGSGSCWIRRRLLRRRRIHA